MKLLKLTKIAFFTIPFLLAVPLVTYAAPAVTTVSGSVSHGATVTVSGSGFGTKSPIAPAQWDPIDGMYSSIVENATIPVDGGNPWGSYSGSMDLASFTLTNNRGKWNAKYSNKAAIAGGGWNGVVGQRTYSGATGGKLYISYWAYPHTDPNNPGASNKYFRLTDSAGWGQTGDGVFAAIIWEPCITQLFDGGGSGGFTYDRWTNTGFSVGTWNRAEIIVDNTPNPKPVLTININNSQFLHAQSGDGQGTAGGAFTGSLRSDITRIYTIGADWSNAQNSPTPRFDFGEIYVDTTLARVEICNASTKASSNHCEIQIPKTQWIDGTLQITVNQGSFATGTTAYLYVVDASGTASAGKPVTFGAGPGQTVPNAPVLQ